MMWKIFQLIELIICYIGGLALSYILSPVLNIKDTAVMVLLALFFMTIFYTIGLFIRDRFL